MRIHSETTEQQGSDYVHAMVNAIRVGQGPGRMIGDSVAVTIAAWWQSPVKGNGLSFAELASTGNADFEELLSDIEVAFGQTDNDDDRFALMALFTWVINKAR